MREPKQQNYYIPLPEILKSYSKRLAKLHQEVSEMKHYWKIRCKERKLFRDKNKRLSQQLNRMVKIEKAFAKLLKRKYLVIHNTKLKRNAKNQRCYPLFISHHERARLVGLLKGFTKDKKIGERTVKKGGN